MSIKKWLTDDKIGKDWKKREEKFNSLSKEQKEDLKKKKIKDIIQEDEDKNPIANSSEDFFNHILLFKEWLNKRNYLKGDVDKIETWVRNLYTKLNFEKTTETNDYTSIKKKYKSIPPTFLDEKTRIALNKKLRNIKRTSSDNYYLSKLKNTIKERLKEAKYYETLRRILES